MTNPISTSPEPTTALLVAAHGAGASGPPCADAPGDPDLEDRVVTVAGRSEQALERERVDVQAVAGRCALVCATARSLEVHQTAALARLVADHRHVAAAGLDGALHSAGRHLRTPYPSDHRRGPLARRDLA